MEKTYFRAEHWKTDPVFGPSWAFLGFFDTKEEAESELKKYRKLSNPRVIKVTEVINEARVESHYESKA